MKRRCAYCGVKLKGKDMNAHIFEAHLGRGKEFFCRDGCVRCCSDVGAPLELALADIEGISDKLGISCEEFFQRYVGVLWSNISGTSALIPSTGLPFPCKFLEEGRCRIYSIRPLHCRLFPERLYINPSPRDFESFSEAGYVCIDDGVFLSEERREEVKLMMNEDEAELLRTAEFFNNEDYIYELTEGQYKEIQRILGAISETDPERNRKRRLALEGMIPQMVKDEAWKNFLSRLRELDKSKRR